MENIARPQQVNRCDGGYRFNLNDQIGGLPAVQATTPDCYHASQTCLQCGGGKKKMQKPRRRHSTNKVRKSNNKKQQGKSTKKKLTLKDRRNLDKLIENICKKTKHKCNKKYKELLKKIVIKHM